jgi:hypothetical protein
LENVVVANVVAHEDMVGEDLEEVGSTDLLFELGTVVENDIFAEIGQSPQRATDIPAAEMSNHTRIEIEQHIFLLRVAAAPFLLQQLDMVLDNIIHFFFLLLLEHNVAAIRILHISPLNQIVDISPGLAGHHHNIVLLYHGFIFDQLKCVSIEILNDVHYRV